MRVLIKRTVGILLLANLAPLLCIALTISQNEIHEYGYMIPYMAGWLINLFGIFVIGIAKFIAWCFDV